MAYYGTLEKFRRRKEQLQRSINLREKRVELTSYSGAFNFYSKLLAPPVIAVLGTLLWSQITNGSNDPMDNNKTIQDSVAFKIETQATNSKGQKSYNTEGQKVYSTTYDLLIVVDKANHSFNIYESNIFGGYTLISNRTEAQTELMDALAALSSGDENILVKLHPTLSHPLQTSIFSANTVERKTNSTLYSNHPLNGDYANNLKSIIQDFLKIVSVHGYTPSDANTQNWSWGKKSMLSTLGLELAFIFAAVCSRLSLGHAKRKLEELESKPPAIGLAGLRFSLPKKEDNEAPTP